MEARQELLCVRGSTSSRFSVPRRLPPCEVKRCMCSISIPFRLTTVIPENSVEDPIRGVKIIPGFPWCTCLERSEQSSQERHFLNGLCLTDHVQIRKTHFKSQPPACSQKILKRCSLIDTKTLAVFTEAKHLICNLF